MKRKNLIAIFLGTILLLLGILLGISDLEVNIRKLHIFIGFSFIIIIIFGLRLHYLRLMNKSPFDFIAWIHFFIFSFLLFISIRALKRWYLT